jgi:gliding motility-associated-like protein
MKNIKLYLAGLFYLGFGFSVNAQFITTWKTDNPGTSNNDQITIPTTGSGYNYDITWEEVGNLTNNGTEPSGQTGNYTITFPSAGTYTVTITGAFPRIYFNAGGFFGDNNDYRKILTVEQWGNNAWTSMANAFSGCENLRINAPDAPILTGATDMSYMFRECSVLNDDLSGWDVSTITNMTGVFRKAISFNQPLDTWDVSSVLSMAELFQAATVFDQPLNSWNVNNVTNMNEMFQTASNFNQNIGNWNVSNVLDMGSMFGGAKLFNQDISYKPGGGNFGGDAWNTGSVTNMNQMFSVAEAFNQDISNWNTSSVANIGGMFSGALVFNQDISGWNISGVNSLSSLFRNALAFNQDLSGWNAYFSGINNMSSMFDGATAFNQDLSGWDVSNVTDMSSMFANTNFDPNISGWNVSNVSSFGGMFEDNTSFNQNISTWNITSANSLGGMFRGATAFNQNISTWDVTSVNSLGGMFSGATAFNQNLGGWDVSNVTNFNDMLNNSGLSIENYDNLLIGWSSLTLQANRFLGAQGMFYCSGEAARNTIITNFGWMFSDEGPGCIAVFEGNNTTGLQIIDGQAEPIDFGSINISPGSKTLSFTIDNQITAGITNFDLSITNNTGTAFTLVPTPALPITISAGSPLTLSVTLSNLTVGTFTETVSLTADNFSNPFVFTITGVVTATPEPEISVFEGPTAIGNPILDGDISGFFIGVDLRGTNVSNQITITNNGSQVLTVSSLSVSGTAFSLSPSAPFTLPVDGTQTITITLDGTVAGNYSETLTINSDDVDETVFDFLITGIIEGPDIAVFDGPDRFISPQISNAQFLPVNFGNALQGTDIVKQVTFANFGLVDLAISNITITGTAFSISATPPILIPKEVDGVVSTVTYTITLTGASIGDFNETVFITSDDDAKSLFTFNITGKITDPAAAIPYMYWTDANGNEINRSELDGTAFEQYHTEPTYTPLGIAIDSLNGTVYWTNNWGQIRKGEIDATGFINVSDFINDGIDINREMGGLSLDVFGGKIYWASTWDGAIKSADLFAASPITTVQTVVTGLKNPISVAVDPSQGVLYYTENDSIGSIATLKKINVDGTPADVAIIWADTIAAQIFTYRDVKLDFKNGKIFWSGGGDDIFNPIGVIYSALLFDVSNTLSSFSTINSNPIGIDLDLNNGKIYWVDNFVYMTSAVIARANLDGSIQEVLHDGTTNPNQPSFITLGTALSPTACVNPPTTNAGIDQTICEGSTSTLAATLGGGATSNLWTTSGDGTFDDNTSLTAVYTPGTTDITAGTVSLTLTTDDPDGPGQCLAATDTMIITISQAPTVNAGLDMVVCETDIITLNGIIGGAATSALWTTNGDGTFDDNTSLSAIYTPGANDLSGGTFALTLTTDDPDGAGPCIAAIGFITVDLEYEYFVSAGNDQTICSGDPATLNGSTDDPTQAVLWTTAGDGTFDDDTSLTPNYTPGTADQASGSVTLTLENAATSTCTPSFDDIIISINQPITAVNQTGSLNVAETITIDVTNGATLNPGDVLTTTLVTNPQKGSATINMDGSISYTAAAGTVGADSFDFEICNQCNLCSSALVNITIANSAPKVAVPSSTISAGGVVVIDVLAGITDDNNNIDLSSLKIIIQPLSGAVASFDASGMLTVDYSGLKFAGTDKLTIEVCDVDGLCTSQEITIEVEPPGVVVYNAVSPNGDGKHDFLEIENAEFFTGNKVQVMNRWGDVVYQVDGYDNATKSFTGVANSNGNGELPPGTYYYNIVLGDGSPELNGFFRLRR